MKQHLQRSRLFAAMRRAGKRLTAVPLVRAILIAVCLALSQAPGAAAFSINYVGHAPLADFRTASVSKPSDADGDNVFGTAGYVFYGTDPVGNGSAGRVATVDPLTYSSGTIRTKLSLPSWIALVNNGQNSVAASYPSYPQIDDPQLPPGSSVGDMQLGLAVRLPNTLGTPGSMVDIRFGDSTPATGVRVGVACFASTGDAIDVIRLTSNFGDSAFGTRESSTAATIYFFDIVGVQGNDRVTLHLTKNIATGGNANLTCIGITFDALSSSKPPIVSLITPTNASAYAAPLHTVIEADAMSLDGFVTNVAFYVNGVKLTDVGGFPHAAAWNAVPAGDYALFAVATDAAGLSGTSGIVRVIVTNTAAPPAIVSKSPQPGALTRLTQLTVTFSKVVQGVDAGDLLINGVAATNVIGSASNYTFQFSQPACGPVLISWTDDHGITDTLFPPIAFNHKEPGSTWPYELLGPPRIAAIQVTNGVSAVMWESHPGARYQLETAVSLPATNWAPLGSDITATDLMTVSFASGADPQKFYRVVLLELPRP
jgi:hypothetical protein